MLPACTSLVRMAAVLFAGCLLTACKNDLREVIAQNQKRISIEEGYNIESYLSQQAKIKARLTAPLMMRYLADTTYVEFPRSLHVDFFDDSVHIESKLDAHYGKYKENDQKVFLKDSVVIFNMKGDTLWCRELWWDQQLQQFTTNKPVRIRQPDKIIYGKGLTAAQNMSWYTLDSVTGIIQVPRAGLQ